MQNFRNHQAFHIKIWKGKFSVNKKKVLSNKHSYPITPHCATKGYKHWTWVSFLCPILFWFFSTALQKASKIAIFGDLFSWKKPNNLKKVQDFGLDTSILPCSVLWKRASWLNNILKISKKILRFFTLSYSLVPLDQKYTISPIFSSLCHPTSSWILLYCYIKSRELDPFHYVIAMSKLFLEERWP